MYNLLMYYEKKYDFMEWFSNNTKLQDDMVIVKVCFEFSIQLLSFLYLILIKKSSSKLTAISLDQ